MKWIPIISIVAWTAAVAMTITTAGAATAATPATSATSAMAATSAQSDCRAEMLRADGQRPAEKMEKPEKSEKSGTSEKGARLVLPVATYDFGDVARKGGALTRDFVFRNEGSAPLVIVRVLTSCSCFKATFSRRPVAPGDEGVIRVTYEPLKSEPGVFNKVLQIYSNSVAGREVITVQGNSVE